MKRIYQLAAGAAALFSLAQAPTTAHAQETGLAAIHEWVPVGRTKICMATHFHDGTGTGKTKKDAERAAIRSWEAFTIWEYGPPWGRYALSETKSLNCNQSGGKEFSCQVSSRACISRTARGRRKR
jgi:hypothetical protein